MHEPNSLTPAERELIATYVSIENDCYYCQTIDGAIAAASHTFLTAAEDCQVRADLTPDWFDQFVSRIHSGWSDITPGAVLKKMGTNYDVRGVGGVR